jgi:hypothetical protein
LRTINDCIRTLLLSQCSTSLVLGRGTEHGNVPHQPAAMSRHRPGHAAPPTPRCSATLPRAPRLRPPLLPQKLGDDSPQAQSALSRIRMRLPWLPHCAATTLPPATSTRHDM